MALISGTVLSINSDRIKYIWYKKMFFNKKVFIYLSVFLILALMTVCHDPNRLNTVEQDTLLEIGTMSKIPDGVDKIIVVLSMGNPKYGAESKTITNHEDIDLFVKSLNHAKLGKKAQPSDVMPSYYYFYSNDILIAEFSFNGNDSDVIFINENYYHVIYSENMSRPYELYQHADAETVTIYRENGATGNWIFT